MAICDDDARRNNFSISLRHKNAICNIAYPETGDRLAPQTRKDQRDSIFGWPLNWSRDERRSWLLTIITLTTHNHRQELDLSHKCRLDRSTCKISLWILNVLHQQSNEMKRYILNINFTSITFVLLSLIMYAFTTGSETEYSSTQLYQRRD